MYRKLFSLAASAYLVNAKKNKENKSFSKAIYEINTEINTLEDLKAHNENYETTFMIFYTDSTFISSAQGPLCVNYEDDAENPCFMLPKSDLMIFAEKILNPLTDIDVQVAAVDCDENEETKVFCSDQGVMRYPSFKLYDRYQYPLTWMSDKVDERLQSSYSLPPLDQVLNWVNHNIITESADSSKQAVNRFVSNMSGGLLFQMIREKLKLVLFCNRSEDVCLTFQVKTWKMATEKGFSKLPIVKKNKMDFAYVDCGTYDEICDGYRIERDLEAKRSNSNFHSMAHKMATQDENKEEQEDKNSTRTLAEKENLVVMLLASGKEVYRTKIDRATFRYTEFTETVKDVIRDRLDDNYQLLEEVVPHDEL